MPLLAYLSHSTPPEPAGKEEGKDIGRRQLLGTLKIVIGQRWLLTLVWLLGMSAPRKLGLHSLQRTRAPGARKAGWVGGMGWTRRFPPAALWEKQQWTCCWTKCAQGKPGISSYLCDGPLSSLSLPALSSLTPTGLYCYGNNTLWGSWGYLDQHHDPFHPYLRACTLQVPSWL